jgi:hypothetical protein
MAWEETINRDHWNYQLSPLRPSAEVMGAKSHSKGGLFVAGYLLSE